MTNTTQRSRPQKGATLIEVLVSIVIASIGLLALAGINAASLRYGKLSQYRAVATLLASDISERMRVNYLTNTAVITAYPSGYKYNVDYATQQNIASETEPAGLPPNKCLGAADVCTPQQLAAADMWNWRRRVASQLPGGAVFINPDGAAAAAGAVDLWIAWKDAAVSNADEQVLTGGAKECPNDLELGSDTSVRCMFFRIRL